MLRVWPLIGPVERPGSFFSLNRDGPEQVVHLGRESMIIPDNIWKQCDVYFSYDKWIAQENKKDDRRPITQLTGDGGFKRKRGEAPNSKQSFTPKPKKKSK